MEGYLFHFAIEVNNASEVRRFRARHEENICRETERERPLVFYIIHVKHASVCAGEGKVSERVKGVKDEHKLLQVQENVCEVTFNITRAYGASVALVEEAERERESARG